MADDLLTLFNFEVQITISGQGGDEGLANDSGGAFSEVSGLELNIEHQEIREGGYHLGSRQLLGKTTSPALILKRGMTTDVAFWRWIQRCTEGDYPLPYVDGEVIVRSARGAADAKSEVTWAFVNGVVTKVRTADLNAVGPSAVPIEELHIVHEGLARRI